MAVSSIKYQLFSSMGSAVGPPGARCCVWLEKHLTLLREARESQTEGALEELLRSVQDEMTQIKAQEQQLPRSRCCEERDVNGCLRPPDVCIPDS